MTLTKLRRAAVGIAAATTMLFTAMPTMADTDTGDDAPTNVEEATPGTTFEFTSANNAKPLAGFDPELHGATTLRGDTWATPETGPSTQTATGQTWPQYGANETPEYYGWGCHVEEPGTSIIGCVVNPNGTTDVAVVGSSYIGQWMPAILEIAERENWSVTIYTKTWCDFQPGRTIDNPKPYPQCDVYTPKVLERLKSTKPDIIFSSHHDNAARSHIQGVYNDLIKNYGVKHVVGIWNTMSTEDEGAGISKGAWCVRDVQAGVPSQYNNFKLDFRECDYAMKPFSQQGANPAMKAIDGALPNYHFIDLQGWFCPTDSTVAPRCPAIIGRVMPWRNGAHVTNEWTASMTNVVHEALYLDGVTKTRPGTTDVSRVSGTSRYDTSAAVSAGVPTGRRVFVTTGVNFPDALTAGAEAGELGSAVLLTKANHLPSAVSSRLKALKPSEVILVGGTSAVSNKVRDQIKSATGVKVTRVGGENRYDTAAKLATMPGYKTGGTVYVASGLDFPDALTTSALAGSAGPQSTTGGISVLLTKPNALPNDTRAALTKLKPSKIVVIGGTGAISNATMNQLKNYSSNVTRVAGADRYETAAKLTAGAEKGRTVYVSVGSDFADANSVAPIAARNGSLLLVKTDAIPQSVRRALIDLEPSKIVVVGGTSAINSKVQRELAQYIH